MLQAFAEESAEGTVALEEMGLRMRAFADGDVPAIVGLINRIDEEYGLHEGSSIDEFRRGMEAPRVEPEKQIVVIERADAADSSPGKLLAYGRTEYENDEEGSERIYYLRVQVDPSAENSALEDAVARRLLHIVRGYESGGTLARMERVTLKAYVREEVHYQRALWERVGLKPVRQYWIMARPLDLPIDEPAPVEGVVVRTYRDPDDHEPLRHGFNNSFSDHYDHHTVSAADWLHYMTRPNIKTALSWLAEFAGEPGNIVGFCICGIFEEENARRGVREGWIEILGTTRECRRKGLGRALLLNGLHSLRAAGMETALLGVDSQSLTGAQRLYESVGFRTRSREIQYDGTLTQVRL